MIQPIIHIASTACIFNQLTRTGLRHVATVQELGNALQRAIVRDLQSVKTIVSLTK